MYRPTQQMVNTLASDLEMIKSIFRVSRDVILNARIYI